VISRHRKIIPRTTLGKNTAIKALIPLGGILIRGPAYFIRAERRPDNRNNFKINPI
jgi:hypothetical protein